MVYTYKNIVERLTDQSVEDFNSKLNQITEAYISEIIAKRKKLGLEIESLRTTRRITDDKLIVTCVFD